MRTSSNIPFGNISVVSADPIVGADDGEGTPVPIPNTAVKLTRADNTWLEAARNDRRTPLKYVFIVASFGVLKYGCAIFLRGYKELVGRCLHSNTVCAILELKEVSFLDVPAILDDKVLEVVALFSTKRAVNVQTINTSHGDVDFRETHLVMFDDGKRLVVKLADNDFTFPEKIQIWQKTVEEYRQRGYYCPAIFSDIRGTFPIIEYKGRCCVAYAEEFAPFRSADTFSLSYDEVRAYSDAAWQMTAVMAQARLNYTEYPSGYCLYDVFCESDPTDEVLENANSWVEYAKTLPDEFQEQIMRIWRLWEINRAALEPLYRTLPTSVFQADLNKTNILLDENGRFAGVYDFNLCGKDVFLNYLFRETVCDDFEKERAVLCQRLAKVSKHYVFENNEKEAALMLYRCLKPLSFDKLAALKAVRDDICLLKMHLEETEKAMTEYFDFAQHMS